MFGLGTTELIIVMVIVMILFGAGRLPEIGSGLGRGIRNFKRATKGEDEIDVTSQQDTDSLQQPSAGNASTVAQNAQAEEPVKS